MTMNGRGEIDENIQLLQLTSACDGQEARDRVFTILAAIAETHLPPLNGVAQRGFRDGMPRAELCRVLQFSSGRIASHRTANAA
jgi:hypothetical protein